MCLLGDTNLDLLKSAPDNFSHDFLLSLISCYLIPSIDKTTRVYKTPRCLSIIFLLAILKIFGLATM